MRYAFALLIASALPAQIRSLTTTADGSELQFVSNYGTPADPARLNRLYTYAPGQPLELFRAADPYVALQPQAPLLSADGRTRGMVTYSPCFGSCMFYMPRTGVVLTRNGRTFEYKAQGTTQQLSRNGRWLFDGGFPNFSARLIDIDSGAVTTLPATNPLHAVNAVADDGALLTTAESDRNAVTLITGATRTTFALPDAVLSAAILPDGKRMFALTKSTLYELNPLRELYASATPLAGFSLSASGDVILVHDGRQVIRVAPGAANPIYESPEPIQELLLTDDGQTSFLLTRSSRLTRITSGVTADLYPPFPALARQTSAGGNPGSLLRLTGGPFPGDLTVTVGGIVFPKIAGTAETYEVQIPWDFPVAPFNSFVLTTAGSPFALSGNLFLGANPVAAVYTVDDSRDAKAVQQDFQSLISPSNPAPAGSLIHFWLTGLGPLDRPLRTGEPGPADVPARPLAPFACYIFQGDAVRGLELPFAAYAPGLVGVYQVDAVIPADWPAGQSLLGCAAGQDPPVSFANLYIRGTN